MDDQKRRAWFIAVGVGLIIAAAWYTPLTRAAEAFINEGLERSLYSFAIGRGLGAVISMIQGTEVAMQPFGFGLTLAPGQLLGPINELVAYFSSVMLWASVAFGVQKVLLALSANWTVSALITGLSLVWGVLFYKNRAPNWLHHVAAMVVFVRFIMPITMVGSSMVYEHFFADSYTAQVNGLQTTTTDLRGMKLEATPPDGEASSPWSLGLKQRYDRFVAGADDMKRKAELASQHIVHLIVTFLMQTVVIPLIMLWVFYRLLFWLPNGLTRGARAPTP